VKIHILRELPTEQQMKEMLEELKTVIKLAVDVERGIIAGGGEWHADCEKALLETGSRQENIWGADWSPKKNEVTFEALLNIRPRQNNRNMVIRDPELRARIEWIVRTIFEGKAK
jgi:uncharacterized protein DUF5674